MPPQPHTLHSSQYNTHRPPHEIPPLDSLLTTKYNPVSLLAGIMRCCCPTIQLASYLSPLNVIDQDLDLLLHVLGSGPRRVVHLQHRL
jgi:hypothetical protein